MPSRRFGKLILLMGEGGVQSSGQGKRGEKSFLASGRKKDTSCVQQTRNLSLRLMIISVLKVPSR